MNTDKKEALARYAHEAWSGWMKYLWSRSRIMNIAINGIVQRCVVIPHSLVVRWERQMNTPYNDLPEDEKFSDMQEADRILKILGEEK
jgi:hypothetical protein